MVVRPTVGLVPASRPMQRGTQDQCRISIPHARFQKLQRRPPDFDAARNVEALQLGPERAHAEKWTRHECFPSFRCEFVATYTSAFRGYVVSQEMENGAKGRQPCLQDWVRQAWAERRDSPLHGLIG